MLQLKIVSPERIEYEGRVYSVLVPGTMGQFEILTDHAPIISSLSAGKIRLLSEGEDEKIFDIKAGVLKGQQNEILILVQ